MTKINYLRDSNGDLTDYTLYELQREGVAILCDHSNGVNDLGFETYAIHTEPPASWHLLYKSDDYRDQDYYYLEFANSDGLKNANDLPTYN